MADLFIGITTWDDAPFIERALKALRKTLEGVDVQYVAWDNNSTDNTCDVLRAFGVRYYSQRRSQSEALNALLSLSKAPYSLLMHSDTIVLHSNWFPMLREAMQRTGAALISPEDIGLGNMLRRDTGAGMPESSFLFFDTAKAFACRIPKPNRFLTDFLAGRKVNPLHRLNLYVGHVTHKLPAVLAAQGYTWLPMRPLTSVRLDAPWFTPAIANTQWDVEWGHYDYGFGNFYAFEGVITHYHNWYARFIGQNRWDNSDTSETGQITHAYCEASAGRFLADLDAGTLRLPPVE